MIRNIKLEKYIKKHTGYNIKVFIVNWIKGGYGATMNFVTGMKICKSDMYYKPLIWHEMGHLMAEDNNWIKNEYKAERWALKSLKKLKYNNIYKESIDWIKIWGTRGQTKDDKGYRKVSKMLLNKGKI